MKITRLFIFALGFFVDGVGLCEIPFQLSEIQGKDFSTISVEDARAIARRVDGTGMGDNADAFIQTAMKSGRPEIIGLIWEHSSISSTFWEILQKMPESHLKDQLISSRLRNNRIRWPDESSFNGVEELATRDYFIPWLRKYLPDLPMDYAVMDSREKRLKLADAFDKAAGIPIVEEPEARRVGPPPRLDKHAGTSGVQGSPRAAGASTVATAPGVSTTGESRLGDWALWAGITAVLVAAAGWLLLRSKGKKG